jgi:hypothetical protein
MFQQELPWCGTGCLLTYKISRFIVCEPLRHRGVVAVAMDNKKSLPQTGIDPMELAFKASLLTHFRGKWDLTGATHFQGKCHDHCTTCATIFQQIVSSVNRKLDKKKSFVSLQEQHVHAWEFSHFLPSIPTLPTCDMELNESDVRLYNNKQCGMYCMCQCYRLVSLDSRVRT